MVSGIVAHKIGMTQIFKNGKPIPVTILKLDGGIVLKVMGKRALIGFDETKAKNIPKPQRKIMEKLGKYFKIIKEFDIFDQVNEGDKVSVSIFSEGEKVKITGTSKGRGFQGVVKRWGFSGGPASHGSMSHRRPGSIGQKTEPGRVWKGKKMAGHMGMRTVTMNLVVEAVYPEEELILVRGSVPGWKGAPIILKKQENKK